MAEDKVFYAVKGRLVFHRPQCRFISAYDQSRLTKVSDYGSGIVITTCAAYIPLRQQALSASRKMDFQSGKIQQMCGIYYT